MMKRVLIVSTKYPFPTDDGKKTVLAGFLAYLLDRCGRDHVTYVVVGRKGGQPAAEPACRTMWVAPPGRLTQIWNVFLSLCGLSQKSLQEALTYAPRIERMLAGLVSEAKPDVLLLDTLRMGQYFWGSYLPNCLRVLFMDDLFYLRFRRMLRTSATNDGVRFDPAGTFAPSLPGIARKLIKIAPLQNLLYRIESTKSERREVESPRQFDRCLLMNPNEARILRERCAQGSIRAVKPLLRVARCAPPRKFDGAPLFLLFGSLRHPVHRASVMQFLERSLDEALHAIPDARIEIVGDGADAALRTHCSRFGDHVAIRGFVERIDELFSSACALLVPLVAPGGLKLKTLTALFYGLPIVATDSGVDGILLRDGIDFLRENDLARFSRHMIRLCDVPFNREISANASRAFHEHYAKAQVYQDYDDIFECTSQ
jgi:glycosyltransferase involved in cell wall biosynthesis